MREEDGGESGDVGAGEDGVELGEPLCDYGCRVDGGGAVGDTLRGELGKGDDVRGGGLGCHFGYLRDVLRQ